MNGILILNKSSGPTSRDVVNRVQRLLPRKTKIGHAGTLDPLASGVLVLAIGTATRLVEYLQDMSKTYRTVVRLGEISDSDDAQGTVRKVDGYDMPERDSIRKYLEGFAGIVEQVPPSVSALKVGGQRAYDIVRRQGEVELKARFVRIDGIEILGYEWPKLDLRIHCGKGTYIRSIARDIGTRFACGGLVETLVRERIGPFSLDNAIGDDLTLEGVARNLRPMAEAVGHLFSVTVSPDEAASIRQGKAIYCTELTDSEEVALIDEIGELIAIAYVRTGLVHPAKVFSNAREM